MVAGGSIMTSQVHDISQVPEALGFGLQRKVSVPMMQCAGAILVVELNKKKKVNACVLVGASGLDEGLSGDSWPPLIGRAEHSIWVRRSQP